MEPTSSTENGRTKLIAAIKDVNDDFLVDFSENELNSIKYHVKHCYKPYILKAERVAKRKQENVDKQQCKSEEERANVAYIPRLKRRKSNGVDSKVCVICQNYSYKKDHKLYRICENDRAELMLAATKFNLDSVYTRLSIYNTKEKLFAADVFCHKQCINRYLLQYKRDQDDTRLEQELCDDVVMEQFELFVSQLHLSNTGYTISYCRDLINDQLPEQKLNNKQVKRLLIEHYGNDICFTYPKDQKQSQIFFSSHICPADVVEHVRTKENINQNYLCGNQLRKECQSFEFLLDQSYCDANDAMLSSEQYAINPPVAWESFFDGLFPKRKKSITLQKKCEVIFQIIYYVINNGHKKTPLHVSIAESVHDKSRSKKLIQVLNNLGICISYEELERIDCSLANRIIKTAGNNRVPVPPKISPSVMIHGAMDNFDHIENTPSGKDSSHDTILMLFQNSNNDANQQNAFSVKEPNQIKTRSLDSTLLDCQKVLPFRKSGRGEIPSSFHY